VKRALAVLAGCLLLTGCAQTGGAVMAETASLAGPASTGTSEGRYRLSGAVELRPVQMSDDGVRTYIVWSEQQDLPAVFAINTTGGEEMVDGYMRGTVFTIDRIHRRLMFRIDRKAARADRIGG
jgi:type IV secretion system protein VirB9